MDIGKDTFVILEYRVKLEDGTYIKGEDGPVSLNFIVGYGQILQALEKRLLGLEAEAETKFTIPAREAFGERDENLVRTRTFAEFPEGRNLEPGRWIVATNELTQAQYSYFVKDKTEDAVVLDYNHPLAGKDLHYQVKVAHVRPAAQEELEYLRPCEHGPDSEEACASIS
jgi:FKBP-type peptidyl-prolyl cis-trans isomerase SlyD